MSQHDGEPSERKLSRTKEVPLIVILELCVVFDVNQTASKIVVSYLSPVRKLLWAEHKKKWSFEMDLSDYLLFNLCSHAKSSTKHRTCLFNLIILTTVIQILSSLFSENGNERGYLIISVLACMECSCTVIKFNSPLRHISHEKCSFRL